MLGVVSTFLALLRDGWGLGCVGCRVFAVRAAGVRVQGLGFRV